MLTQVLQFSRQVTGKQISLGNLSKKSGSIVSCSAPVGIDNDRRT
jgi:hypothetical protein